MREGPSSAPPEPSLTAAPSSPKALSRAPSQRLSDERSQGGGINAFSSISQAAAFAARSAASADSTSADFPPRTKKRFLLLAAKGSEPCCTSGLWKAYAGDTERDRLGEGPRARVRRAVETALLEHPSCRLLISGHSLGGALAQLCAVDLLCNCALRAREHAPRPPPAPLPRARLRTPCWAHAQVGRRRVWTAASPWSRTPRLGSSTSSSSALPRSSG